MLPRILTLFARLIGDFNIASCNYAVSNQQVMHDAGSSSAYLHWLVLGPFQIGTRGWLHFLLVKSIGVLI